MRFRPLASLLWIIVVLVLVPVAAVTWLLTTESGLRAALEIGRKAGGLEIVADGTSGKLIGPLKFDALRVEGPSFRVALRDFSFDWSPRALIKRRVEVHHLDIAHLSLATAPSDQPSEPMTEPPALSLPVEVAVGRLQIDEIVVAGWEEDADPVVEVHELLARLSADSGLQRLDEFSVTTAWGQLALTASVASDSPNPLSAAGRFSTVQDEHEIELDFNASGSLERLAARLEARGAGLSGEAVAELAPFATIPLLSLQAAIGEIDPSLFVEGAPHAALRVEADLGSDGAELRLQGDVHVTNAQPMRLDQGGLPLESIVARIDARQERIELPSLQVIVSGGGRLAAEGHFVPPVDEAPGTFAVSGQLVGINPMALHGEAPQGKIGLDFKASGDAPGPIAAEWVFTPGQVRDLAHKGGGALKVDGTQVSDVAIDMGLGPNRIQANGAWGALGDVLNLAVDARALDQLGYGLGGTASLKAQVSGTLEAPAGNFTLRGDALRLPGDISIGGVDAAGRADKGIAGPFNLKAEVLDVRGGAEQQSWVERLDLVFGGTMAKHSLDLKAALPENDGAVVKLEGSWAPAGWSGRLAEFELSGRFPLQLEVPADLSASSSRATVAPATFQAGQFGRIEIEEAVWTPERIATRGRLSGLSIVMEQGQAGRARMPEPLTLGAEWNVALTNTINGQIRVFREGGDLMIPGELPTRIGIENLEAAIVATNNRITATLDARGEEIGVIDGRAAVLVENHRTEGWRLAPNSELDGLVRVDMPSISWISRMLQQRTVLDGSLKAEVALSGLPAQPVATGQIAGSNLAVSLLEHGVQLSGGELLAEFNRDRLQISRLEFISASTLRPRDSRIPFAALTKEPGRLSASGGIDLESGDGRFNFEADRFPVLQRSDRWMLLSGEGEAITTWTSLDLEAEFRADAGYFEFPESPPPSLSDDVVILGTEEEASEGGGFAVNATVRVLPGDALYVSALGLNTRLAGAIELRLRDGSPLTANGTISTVGGVFRGYGQNLTIDRGIINFQGPLDNPGLNIVALRKGLAVEAGVRVSGSARRPLIQLVSDPEVPDQEKLSWIVLGRAPNAASGADLSLLIPAAQALLGGSGPGITEQLQRGLGLDEFGIGQSESSMVGRTQTSRVVGSGTAITSEGTVGSQVLMLGKRLSDDFHLSFEQSLGGAESLVRLTYQLSRRVVMVARGGTDNAADIYYTISFR